MEQYVYTILTIFLVLAALMWEIGINVRLIKRFIKWVVGRR